MSYLKPFQLRSPSFRRVQYEFTYATEEAALAALKLVSNKKYTLTAAGDYILPIGHRLHTRDEAVSGNVLTFIAQLKASEAQTDNPDVQSMELEVAGTDGSLTGKVVL